MNVEDIRNFALSLSNVTEDSPFGDDNVVFRVGGKIFLCLSLDAEERHFAIKLLPQRNDELRMQNDNIRPAWHWNKKHWSDIYYESGIDGALVKTLILESYRLIVSKLPKCSRLTIINNESNEEA